jgi:class 3 adenylate cyclase
MSLPTGTVTFFFTDIEGSTRLLPAHADQYASVLGIHARVLRTAIAGHGGATTGITAAVAAGGAM